MFAATVALKYFLGLRCIPHVPCTTLQTLLFPIIRRILKIFRVEWQKKTWSRYRSEDMKILNVLFPHKVRIESTTCRVSSRTLVHVRPTHILQNLKFIYAEQSNQNLTSNPKIFINIYKTIKSILGKKNLLRESAGNARIIMS